ncbi:MAG: hypothetical protein JO152_01350, partial [Mycobacteriaceae bacterium]|nr:hypothetical protein [Mycobacteriaceae bacterium]
MLATDQTVRLRSFIDAETVRERVLDMAVKPLPAALAGRIPRTVSSRPSAWVVGRILL